MTKDCTVAKGYTNLDEYLTPLRCNANGAAARISIGKQGLSNKPTHSNASSASTPLMAFKHSSTRSSEKPSRLSTPYVIAKRTMALSSDSSIDLTATNASTRYRSAQEISTHCPCSHIPMRDPGCVPQSRGPGRDGGGSPKNVVPGQWPKECRKARVHIITATVLMRP